MQPRNQPPEGAPRATVTSEGIVLPPRRSEAAEPRDSGDKREMSVIGADIVITGNIEASVDLHIEGQVIGDVRCATLILGESSSVNGRIYAARVKVSGSVEGAIDTKDLAVEASARVIADVTYERLRVANGGVIQGSMNRRIPEEGAAAEEPNGKLKLVERAMPSDAAERVMTARNGTAEPADSVLAE